MAKTTTTASVQTPAKAAPASSPAPAANGSAPTRFVTSKDGTRLAYEVHGTGSPLVIVWGAMGVRASPFAKRMRDELAKAFTVHDYDRRGRGESNEVKPYSVQKEVEDLRAICQVAGRDGLPPYVWATSSGAALALEAAAAGVPMRKLVAHEPPYVTDMDPEYPAKVTKLVEEGKRSEAVTLFMRTVGVPGFIIPFMRMMGFWKVAVAAANTLPYDAACMSGFKVPTTRLATIRTPTALLYGTKTPASLQQATKDVAAVVPDCKLRVVEGQNHGIKPKALLPVLQDELR